jgi:prophage regulatory protein
MKILRRPEVEAKTSLSGPTIWRYVQAGTFPQQIQLGPNSVGWIEEEIEPGSSRAGADPFPSRL